MNLVKSCIVSEKVSSDRQHQSLTDLPEAEQRLSRPLFSNADWGDSDFRF